MTRWIWRLLRWFAPVEDPALTIRPPVVKFANFDPALRARTQQRREAALNIRGRARAVESGAKTSDVLRMAKR